MRILLVEDDPVLGASLCHGLKKAGFTLDWVRDGKQAVYALDGDNGYDAMVLDLGLPRVDGHQVLHSVRARQERLGVVVVSAQDQVDVRIESLTMGADDFLTKPFDIRELQARIQAVIRRRGGMAGPTLGNGEIELDPQTHEASFHGLKVMLSAREFSLMHALMVRPGAILSRAQLEEKLYGWGQEVDSNAVEFLIHTVRRKLGKSAIHNVRGVGWFVSKE